MVGFGTPAQQLPMAFDTAAFPPGVSTLRCKPCTAGSCDPQQPRAFDPARSSTFAGVACGPECPSGTCHGSSCSLMVRYENGTVAAGGTFFKDTLALSPSATVPSFAVACTAVDHIHDGDGAAAGVLDLSRSRFSLVSRLNDSGGNAVPGFSYCLPGLTASHGGFLSIGGAMPDVSGGNGVGGALSTPMLDDPHERFDYVVRLSRINVAGMELPLTQPPASRLAVLVVGTSFTFLKPAIYAALRDEFRKQMSQYPVAPPYRVLDTCYNFTGLPGFEVPAIWLEFDGGATLTPDIEQMLFFVDDARTFSCLAFAAAPEESPYSIIGNRAQQTLEVVYDVRGRKVGFIEQSC